MKVFRRNYRIDILLFILNTTELIKKNNFNLVAINDTFSLNNTLHQGNFFFVGIFNVQGYPLVAFFIPEEDITTIAI